MLSRGCKLTQALQRARYAIAWERAWPHLARLLTVVGLFLVVSWAGLWLALPFVARAIGLGLFVLLALAALFPLVRFRWPSREEGLSRLDRGTGIRHRPATALTDTLATQDPVALALWQAQRERTLASIKRIRAGLPSPRLADPRSLGAARAGRGDAGRGLCRRRRRAQAAHRGGVRLERRAGAGQYPGRCLGDAAALYRQAADHPVGRQQGSRALPDAGPLPVPAGTHADRALQRRHARRGRGRRRHRGRADRAGAEGHQRAAFHHRRRRHRACPRALRPAAMEVQPRSPDRAPTIALAKDPERQARGSLQMSYKIEDDYGVTEAQRAVRRARRRRRAERHGRSRGRCSSRRNSRWCCRMRAPATASARP